MSDPDSLSREELLAALAERDAVIEVLLAEIEQLAGAVTWQSTTSASRDHRHRAARRRRQPEGS